MVMDLRAFPPRYHLDWLVLLLCQILEGIATVAVGILAFFGTHCDPLVAEYVHN